LATVDHRSRRPFFSFTGLAFGERYESGAERAAGAMLVALAALFAIEKLI
jgi:hypothetical protein